MPKLEPIQTDLTKITPEEKAYQNILISPTIESYLSRLQDFRCRRCSLSELPNHIVTYRGKLDADIMLIGEAPGKVEDRTGIPFVGPAGKLTDDIFSSVGISTKDDMYIGNIIKCRPVAPTGSGRENFTPRAEQTARCKPFIMREIELVNPRIIIAAGLTAAKNIFGLGEKTRMKHVAGEFFQNKDVPELKGRELIIIYHPAALLHKKDDPELRRTMWEHVKKIKAKVTSLKIL